MPRSGVWLVPDSVHFSCLKASVKRDLRIFLEGAHGFSQMNFVHWLPSRIGKRLTFLPHPHTSAPGQIATSIVPEDLKEVFTLFIRLLLGATIRRAISTRSYCSREVKTQIRIVSHHSSLVPFSRPLLPFFFCCYQR